MHEERVIIYNDKKQKLVGHYYKNQADTLLIYCHGMESFGKYSALMQPIFEAYYHLVGVSLFWFDFTGYGESEGVGKFNHSQRVSDIGSVLSYFKGKYKKIVLAGISLGSVASAIAAIKYKEISKLYLINGIFALKYLYPQFIIPTLLGVLFNREMRDELLYSWQNLKPEKISIPTLVVVGKKDKIVNPQQSFDFYKRLKVDKKIVVIDDGDHGLADLKYIKMYLQEIGKWLRQ